MSLDSFLKAVGSLKFRGTSALFRLVHSPVTKSPAPTPGFSITETLVNAAATAALLVIPNAVQVSPKPKSKWDRPARLPPRAVDSPARVRLSSTAATADESSSSSSSSSSASSAKRMRHETESEVYTDDRPLEKPLIFATPSTQHKHYELATHTVKVRRSGTLSDVNALWDLKATDDGDGDGEDEDDATASRYLDPEMEKSKFFRMMSVDSFDQVVGKGRDLFLLFSYSPFSEIES